MWEATGSGFAGSITISRVALAVMVAVAAGCYRRAPGLGLGLIWLSSVLQVANGLDIAFVQLSVVIVSYGTARYGSTLTLWASGSSIPVGAALALLYVRDHGARSLTGVESSILPPPGIRVSWATAFLFSFLLLSGPWALGLLLRVSHQFRQARVEREQAEVEATRSAEMAALRSEQARLARDVHDVVGHSLAVILAQADSAQFMPDAEIHRIRAAITNISTSARQSLGDVRQVLSSTNDPGEPVSRPPTGMQGLVDGVASAGHDVRSEVDGTPRQLSPEADVVAFHVLQEMLTNTLKHGRRDRPICVQRCWRDDHLRIEVRNVIAGSAVPPGREGLGVTGMQRRLAAIGGRLETRREAVPDTGGVFTATAWVPSRASRGAS